MSRVVYAVIVEGERVETFSSSRFYYPCHKARIAWQYAMARKIGPAGVVVIRVRDRVGYDPLRKAEVWGQVA